MAGELASVDDQFLSIDGHTVEVILFQLMDFDSMCLVAESRDVCHSFRFRVSGFTFKNVRHSKSFYLFLLTTGDSKPTTFLHRQPLVRQADMPALPPPWGRVRARAWSLWYADNAAAARITS